MKIINKLNKIYEYRKTLVSITVVYNLVSAVIKTIINSIEWNKKHCVSL